MVYRGRSLIDLTNEFLFTQENHIFVNLSLERKTETRKSIFFFMLEFLSFYLSM